MRLGGRHVVENLQPRDTAVDGGRNPAIGRRGAQGDDIHGRNLV